MKRLKQRIKKDIGTVRSKRLGLTVMASLIVISGVSYAYLQSRARLDGNTIQTATANLQIAADDNPASYSSAMHGFDFTGVLPGGSFVPENGHSVYLRNNGDVSLKLQLGLTSMPLNVNNVDTSKVKLRLVAVGDAAQTVTLGELMAAYSDGGGAVDLDALLPLGSAESEQFMIQIAMEPDAVTGASANLTNINLAFVGVARPN